MLCRHSTGKHKANQIDACTRITDTHKYWPMQVVDKFAADLKLSKVTGATCVLLDSNALT
jgi:hypothetical protein